jgi:hypothetical protein
MFVMRRVDVRGGAPRDAHKESNESGQDNGRHAEQDEDAGVDAFTHGRFRSTETNGTSHL